ncbi:unnamed protein product [Thelazia callipaeda]|uniref:30S ribosomal protein S17 n=1 Tax=Thelazia callipaeda TaxID=103827 RepID=A0A0N5CRI4_THECL|nr:unnamed protein product [Thelazia callipaeda]
MKREEKRAVRGNLVRFDRSAMRNALVRFGKRMTNFDITLPENEQIIASHKSVHFDHLQHPNYMKDFMPKTRRLQWNVDYLR